MNIPNDGGWGKSGGREATAQLGPGNGPEGLLQGLQDLWRRLSRDRLFLGCVALTGTFCFGLGLLAARENGTPKDPLWIEQLPPEELPGSISTSTPAATESPAPSDSAKTKSTNRTSTPQTRSAPSASAPQTGNYVASKTGSKYYLPACAGAKRIKDENKVWFATKELAAAAGYQPASNCKGL